MWIIPGTLPLTDILELGATLYVPLVKRGVALRVEQVTAVAPHNGTEGDGGIVGAEHRGTHLGNGATQAAGGNPHTVDIAQFALVGTETHRGIALDMLDGLETLPSRQLDARCGDVVL